MILVGIDWAEDHHDVGVMDQDGRVLAGERVAEGIKGVGRLHALIGDYVDDPGAGGGGHRDRPRAAGRLAGGRWLSGVRHQPQSGRPLPRPSLSVGREI